MGEIMKQALITIVTKQPQEEDMIFTTHSEYEENEGGLSFTYDEALADDEEPVSTHLVIGDDNILVERTGGSGGDMFFKKTTTYDTKYRVAGAISLDMRIFTTELNIKRRKDGLDANVGYELFLSGSGIGSMGMDITVDFIS